MVETSPARAAAKRPKAKRGPRPKHVPQRMCVVCRDHAAKRALVRIVRTPEGDIALDPTGKRNGRGAYLCDRPACWRKALQGEAPILARALNIPIPAAALEALRRHAATLPEPASEPAADAAAEGA